MVFYYIIGLYSIKGRWRCYPCTLKRDIKTRWKRLKAPTDSNYHLSCPPHFWPQKVSPTHDPSLSPSLPLSLSLFLFSSFLSSISCHIFVDVTIKTFRLFNSSYYCYYYYYLQEHTGPLPMLYLGIQTTAFSIVKLLDVFKLDHFHKILLTSFNYNSL